MRAKCRWSTAASAIVGVTTGLALVITTGTRPLIGITLCFLSVIALCMRYVKKWTTDTAAERQRLRLATAELDDARQQHQVAAALTLGERERARTRVAEVERHAAESIEGERERADQAEINASQRAIRAEAQADQRAVDEIARLQAAAEEERLVLMMDQYFAGARDAESGQLDAILAMLTARDENIIRLDDRRPSSSTPTGTGPH